MITSCVVKGMHGDGNAEGEPTRKEILKKLKLMGYSKEAIGKIEIVKNDFYPDFDYWLFYFDIIPTFTIYKYSDLQS